MEFKVGQKVKIRKWDDMVSEYGVDGLGDIACDGTFVKGMKPLCGLIFTISEINDTHVYFKKDPAYNNMYTNWEFSTDMIEPATIYPEMPSINIGDIVEATTNKKGDIFCGEKYEVIALAKYKNGVYIRSEAVTDYDGYNCEIPLQQPYSFLTFKELKIVSFGGQL